MPRTRSPYGASIGLHVAGVVRFLSAIWILRMRRQIWKTKKWNFHFVIVFVEKQIVDSSKDIHCDIQFNDDQ